MREATLRSATPDDATAVTELNRVVMPYEVVTPAGYRHSWQNAPEADRLLTLVADLDGKVVGAGQGHLHTTTSEQGASSMWVMVHPSHRRHGIGGRLYDALEEHLRDNGARRTQGWAVDEQETAQWCTRRGFERTRELRFLRLDLTDVDALPPIPPLSEGVTVATFAEIGPEAIYIVDAAASLDEPGDVTADAIRYEPWFTRHWQAPDNDHEASTVVIVGGVPAAFTLVRSDPEGHRIWAAGTGTLREHRGKGLAKLAKSIALRRAAQKGITAAYTSNDEVNRPMLAINEWLGYRACATQWSYVKVL
jgi:GNAT superfamily N-acetyltransferase